MNALEVITVSMNFAGMETVIEILYGLDFSEEKLDNAAASTDISPSLVRLPIDFENIEDLIADLKQNMYAI